LQDGQFLRGQFPLGRLRPTKFPTEQVQTKMLLCAVIFKAVEI